LKKAITAWYAADFYQQISMVSLSMTMYRTLLIWTLEMRRNHNDSEITRRPTPSHRAASEQIKKHFGVEE